MVQQYLVWEILVLKQAKPVMEGKGVLFKIFADIDVFDIEINEKDPEKFVQIVKALEPTFGGINLEDIKAPECFYIEKEIKRGTEYSCHARRSAWNSYYQRCCIAECFGNSKEEN